MTVAMRRQNNACSGNRIPVGYVGIRANRAGREEIQMIRRRSFPAGAAAGLALPAMGKGAAGAPVKFIPQSDLTVLDPIVNTVYTVRNHGYMVFDTLFGMDGQTRMQPQMLDSFSVEDDGKRWKLRLRDGLLWHDGEKVLAR